MFIYRCLLAASVIVGLAISAAHSATYTLEFQSVDQNTWAPGGAASISQSKIEKVSLDGEDKIGKITGERRTQTTPTLDYAAWLVCRAGPFPSFCGKEPSPKFTTIVIDERNGSEIGMRTRGELGIRYGYKLSAGEIDTQADYSATADVPEAGSIAVGETFNLNGEATRTRTQLDASGPEAEASLDLLFELQTQMRSRNCVYLVGCLDTGWFTLQDEGKNDREIVAVTPNEVRWLDGFKRDTLLDPPPLPFGLEQDTVSLSTPLLNQTASLQTDQFARRRVAGDLFVVGKAEGVLVEIGNAEVKLPVGLTATNDDPDNPNGVLLQSEFLTVRMDLDTALRPGGTILSFGNKGPFSFTGSYDIYDIEYGAFLGVYQNLDFTSQLMVDLAFDKPVWIDGRGGGQTSWTGLWDDLPDMQVFETTSVVPTFFLDAFLSNATGIETGPTFRGDLLKAFIRMKIGNGPTLLQGELGPALRLDKNFPLANFDVFTSEFALGGFQFITGEAFTITPKGGVVPEPQVVPLPATAWMLMGALVLGTGAFRRRQA